MPFHYMTDLNFSSLELLLIFTTIVSESVLILLYSRFKVKLKKLSGTGRINDIEVAHNWQTLVKLAMLVIPVVLYLLRSAMTKG